MQSALKTLSLAGAVIISTIGISSAWANWQASNDGKGSMSAEVCLSGSPRLCVKLQCYAWKDGGVYWNIDAPEPEYSPESTSVTWVVDKRLVMKMEMTKGWPGNGVQTYEADFDQTKHQGLTEALKGGSRLTVSSDQFANFTVSLRGSGAALGQTLADCPLTQSKGSTAVQSPSVVEPDGEAKTGKNDLAVDPNAKELAITAAQLPQPVRTTISEIAAMCGSAFLADLTEGRSAEALLAEDIDGDGTYDFLLDHAQFCPDAIMTMCGASHCPMTLFVSNKGTWRQFDYILQGYKEFTAQGFLFECSTPNRKAGVFMENGRLIERNCP